MNLLFEYRAMVTIGGKQRTLYAYGNTTDEAEAEVLKAFDQPGLTVDRMTFTGNRVKADDLRAVANDVRNMGCDA